CPDPAHGDVVRRQRCRWRGHAPASRRHRHRAPRRAAPAGTRPPCAAAPRRGVHTPHRMRILALTNLYPNPLQPHRAAFNRHRFRFLSQLHDVRLIAPVSWRDEWSLRGQGPGIPRDRRTTCDGIAVEHPHYWYTPGILRSQYGRFFEASVRATFDRAVAEMAP